VTVAEGDAEGVREGVYVVDGVPEGGTGVKLGKGVRLGVGVKIVSARSVSGVVIGTTPGVQLAIRNTPVMIVKNLKMDISIA